METILLADDEKMLRDSLRAKLTARGYAVRTVANGAKAVAAVALARPDLVLLDYEMPVMDGLAACRAIRAADPLLPILILTNHDADVHAIQSLDSGADDFISKIVEDEVLFSRLKRALARRAAVESVRAPDRILTLGQVTVDFDRLSVTGPGLDDRLSRAEAAFLGLLATARGRSFTFDEILDDLRREGCIGSMNALRTLACRLKARLGSGGALLVNRRGSGYALL